MNKSIHEFSLLSAEINAIVFITQLVRNQSPFSDIRYDASKSQFETLNGIFPDESGLYPLRVSFVFVVVVWGENLYV